MKIERKIVTYFDNQNNKIKVLGIYNFYSKAIDAMIENYKNICNSLIDENKCIAMNYHNHNSAEIQTSSQEHYFWNINSEIIDIPIDEIRWSISEIAGLISSLNDFDFYDVMMTMGKKSNRKELIDWLNHVFEEIEDGKDDN